MAIAPPPGLARGPGIGSALQAFAARRAAEASTAETSSSGPITAGTAGVVDDHTDQAVRNLISKSFGTKVDPELSKWLSNHVKQLKANMHSITKNNAQIRKFETDIIALQQGKLPPDIRKVTFPFENATWDTTITFVGYAQIGRASCILRRSHDSS